MLSPIHDTVHWHNDEGAQLQKKLFPLRLSLRNYVSSRDSLDIFVKFRDDNKSQLSSLKSQDSSGDLPHTLLAVYLFLNSVSNPDLFLLVKPPFL